MGLVNHKTDGDSGRWLRAFECHLSGGWDRAAKHHGRCAAEQFASAGERSLVVRR